MSIGKGRIPTSAEKVESGRVPKKGLGMYRERVESGRVPERWDLGEYHKCRIRASTENMGSERVPKRWDPDEYREGRNPG